MRCAEALAFLHALKDAEDVSAIESFVGVLEREVAAVNSEELSREAAERMDARRRRYGKQGCSWAPLDTFAPPLMKSCLPMCGAAGSIKRMKGLCSFMTSTERGSLSGSSTASCVPYPSANGWGIRRRTCRSGTQETPKTSRRHWPYGTMPGNLRGKRRCDGGSSPKCSGAYAWECIWMRNTMPFSMRS